jgi:hypothetical protein
MARLHWRTKTWLEWNASTRLTHSAGLRSRCCRVAMPCHANVHTTRWRAASMHPSMSLMKHRSKPCPSRSPVTLPILSGRPSCHPRGRLHIPRELHPRWATGNHHQLIQVPTRFARGGSGQMELPWEANWKPLLDRHARFSELMSRIQQQQLLLLLLKDRLTAD